MRSPCRQRAFTLIELLIVILIIGILIAIAAPSFLGQSRKAQKSVAKQYLTVAYRSGKSIAWAPDSTYLPLGTPGSGGDTMFAKLASSEPELQFAEGIAPNDPHHIEVVQVNPQTVVYAAQAADGKTFCLEDVEQSNYGNTGVNAGLYWASGTGSNACGNPANACTSSGNCTNCQNSGSCTGCTGSSCSGCGGTGGCTNCNTTSGTCTTCDSTSDSCTVCDASGTNCTPCDSSSSQCGYNPNPPDTPDCVSFCVTSTPVSGGSTGVSYGNPTHVSCVPGTTTCVVSFQETSSSSYNFIWLEYNTDVGGASSQWQSWPGSQTYFSSGAGSPYVAQQLDCLPSQLASSSVSCVIAGADDYVGGGGVFYSPSLGGSWSQVYHKSVAINSASCQPTASSISCLAGYSGWGCSGQPGCVNYAFATSPTGAWTEGLMQPAAYAVTGVNCRSSSSCIIENMYGATGAFAFGDTAIASGPNPTGPGGWFRPMCTTSQCFLPATSGIYTILGQPLFTDSANALTAATCTGSDCTAVGNDGSVFESKAGGAWTLMFTKANLSFQDVSCASDSLCAATAVDRTNQVDYVVNYAL